MTEAQIDGLLNLFGFIFIMTSIFLLMYVCYFVGKSIGFNEGINYCDEINRAGRNKVVRNY